MKKIRSTLCFLILSLTSYSMISSFLFNNVSAISNHSTIETFSSSSFPSISVKAANQIYFIQDCIPGKGKNSFRSSGACGDTAREIYWSVLGQHFDPIQIAGIFGNLTNEGSFGPTKWQYNLVASPGAPFQRHSFDELYNWPPCNGKDCAGGVGSFQITSALGPYLQYVNKEAPDLLGYFKDTKYSANGDELLKIMPKEDFIGLVELEVKFVMEVHLDKSAIDDFKSKTDPGDAARWWSVNYERCDDCTDWNSGENDERAASAKQEYETMKNFTCSSAPSPNSNRTENPDNDDNKNKKDDKDEKDDIINSDDNKSSNTTKSGITWIGDSYSVGANAKGLISKNFSDVDLGSGSPDTSTSNIQVSKFVSKNDSSNPSCLKILENTINSNNLRSNLVFACGTNGGWSDSDITKFKSLLKDQNVRAVVVSSKIPGNDYADSNSKLKKLADENDNITLADWAAVYSDDYFKSDKIHPNDDPGYEKWIETISNALGNAKSSCSTSTYEGDYPSYPQCGSTWSNEYYGTNSEGKNYTMCDASCGASSMAMLATVAANQDILPLDVRDLLGGSYYWATSGSGMAKLDQIVGDKYGFEVINVPYDSLEDAETKMKQYLDDDYMLHFSGAGSYPFSTGGHYIGIFGWTDKANNSVMLANSGGHGNKEANLHDVIHAGLHGGSFSAIKKGGGNGKCNPSGDNICPTDSDSGSGNNNKAGSCSAKVLNTVKDLLALAKKNGYNYGGGHDADGSAYFDSILKDGAVMGVDCTGFASLVMYSTFGVKETFWTGSIAGNSNYKEIPKSDIQPGDIFNYNDSANCKAHGGIIINVNGDTITKIAQTGRVSYITDGAIAADGNRALGYSEDSNGINGNLQCANSAPDVKYYRYKECH